MCSVYIGHLHYLSAILVLVFAMYGIPACASKMLFDFEEDTEVSAWSVSSPGVDKLIKSNEYASSGNYSMQFTSPPYKPGMPQWPAFETILTLRDWKDFDRLVVDIINPSPEPPSLQVYISDGGVPSEVGYVYDFDVPTSGYRRFLLSVSDIAKGLDISDVTKIHFFSSTPIDMRLHFDCIALLKPEESEPVVNPGLWRQLAKLKRPEIERVQSNLAEVSNVVRTFQKNSASMQSAEKKLSQWIKAVDSMPAKLEACTTAEDMEKLGALLKSIDLQSCRLKSELTLTGKYKALGMPENGMLIGFASSMTKVLPREMPFDLNVANTISISLARNEKESFQVAVLPAKSNLHKVSVKVSDLKGPEGTVLASANIACEVVGYVETKVKPPYDVSYIGWWPDPILDFIGPVDIAAGDLQTFWVRVRAPKGQKPGVYKGKLTVSAGTGKPSVFNLTVKVRSFTLPDCTPLPTAITAIHPRYFEHIRDDIVGGADKWEKMKFVYADFLADYYIDFDNLYSNDAPDWDIVKHLRDQGRLTAFNLGYFGNDIASNSARFRPRYEKAKELGVLDLAYIYGSDESGEDSFRVLEAAVKALKEEFPGVPVMTTSYDRSYGLDSVANSVDAWCPLTPTYGSDLQQVEKARAAGKMVWWYICGAPLHPYANWFVEYDAIEIRELMGVMAAKYKPDGFLYYSLAFWLDYLPITTGPFTKWNPVSYGTYHGDGTIFLPGPNGRPLPTIRLENYRDGMEDLAYFKILEHTIVEYEANTQLSDKEKSWLNKAKKAVEVPNYIVKSLIDYNKNPDRLEKYREQLADLLESRTIGTGE